MEFQICKKCDENFPLTTDYFTRGINKRNGVEKPYWYKTCRKCDRDRVLEKSYRYKRKNRKLIADKQKVYYQDHKEESSIYHKQLYQETKEDIKKRVKKNLYRRRKFDTNFMLKESISRRVGAAIRKNHNSIAKFLPYSFQQLKDHLEKLFEPSSLMDSERDYVGFFARSVTFGTHHENTLWQPNFGDGPFSHLRDIYFKTLDLRKTWLFPLSKAEETMRYMDNFLMRISKLTAFV